MAMLNFKHGLFKNLPTNISNGTIYVTTDEKAMYVDLNNERIRLSQIITLSTYDWEQLAPPYSTEAFYYLSDSNALLKYDGTNWKQLNSTKALSDAISALDVRLTKIDGANGVLAQHTSSIADLQQNVADLAAADTQFSKDLGEANDAISSALTQIGNLESAIGYIGSGDTLPPADSTNANEIFIHNGVVKIFNGTEWVEYSTIVAAIENLREEFEDLKGSTATDENFDDLNQRLKDVEDWKVEVDQTLTGLDTAVKAAQATADQAKDDAKAAQDDIDDLDELIKDPNSGLAAAHTAANNAAQAAVDAKAAAEAADRKADTAQQAAEAANANADNRVHKDVYAAEKKVLEDAIEEAKGAAGVAQKAADDAATAASDAQKTADQAVKAAADANANADSRVSQETYEADQNALATNLENINKDIEDVDGKAEKNATAISDLTTALNDETTARQNAINGLRDEIVADMQTADAMVFIDTVASASDLPAVGAEVDGKKLSKGWTYKASEEFAIGEDENAILVRIGDLLIATGTEVNGELTSVEWKHIPSGYVADYNPEMTVAVANNAAAIKLTSGVNKDNADASDDGDLGAVVIAASPESAVTVTSDGANGVIIGMSWGSFGETTEE